MFALLQLITIKVGQRPESERVRKSVNYVITRDPQQLEAVTTRNTTLGGINFFQAKILLAFQAQHNIVLAEVPRWLVQN